MRQAQKGRTACVEAPKASWRRVSARVLALALGSGFALVGAARATSEGPQLAYIDPGAGSFVLQALIATFAGAIVAANVYWSRIKRFLGLGTDEGDSDDETDDPSDSG